MKHALSLALTLALAASVFAATPSESQKLHQLFEEEWEWGLKSDPEGATYVGDKRYNALLTDRSEAAWARYRAHTLETLKKLEAIDRSKLDANDQLNYDLYRLQLKDQIEGDRFPYEYLQVSQRGGIHEMLSELAQAVPRDSVKDYEDFLARMRQLPKAVEETIVLMRKGMAAGVTPPRPVLGEVANLIALQVVDDPGKSSIYELAGPNGAP